MRSELQAGLGGQDLSSRKDEINSIIDQVTIMLLWSREEKRRDDEEDGEEDDDDSDFEPGSEVSYPGHKAKKVLSKVFIAVPFAGGLILQLQSGEAG